MKPAKGARKAKRIQWKRLFLDLRHACGDVPVTLRQSADILEDAAMDDDGECDLVRVIANRLDAAMNPDCLAKRRAKGGVTK